MSLLSQNDPSNEVDCNVLQAVINILYCSVHTKKNLVILTFRCLQADSWRVVSASDDRTLKVMTKYNQSPFLMGPPCSCTQCYCASAKIAIPSCISTGQDIQQHNFVHASVKLLSQFHEKRLTFLFICAGVEFGDGAASSDVT